MRTLYSRISRWFPIPIIMEMYYAAVHISSNNVVTYLEMKKSGNDLIPTASERIAFTRKDDEDNEDLIKVLSSIQKKYKTEFIKATVQESKSYLFETEIPKVGEKDLYDAVAFTIEEKAPVALSEVVFGYRVTDISLPNNNVVSVGVVPERVVNGYIDIFQRSGMYPVSLKVEAQAVANAVVMLNSSCNHIVVSIKDNKTIIAIVQNGGVFLSATVEFNGMAFDVILEKNFSDLSKKERDEIKVSKNFFADASNEKVHMEFIEQAGLLKNYLNKYYIYWLTHKAKSDGAEDRKLDSFIIVGDEVTIPGLMEYLNVQLKAKLEPANVWRNCFDIEKHIPNISYADSFDYAEVIGLLIGKD